MTKLEATISGVIGACTGAYHGYHQWYLEAYKFIDDKIGLTLLDKMTSNEGYQALIVGGTTAALLYLGFKATNIFQEVLDETHNKGNPHKLG